MITTSQADLFSFDSSALVIPVNCVGVPGKGLALEWSRRMPGDCAYYVRLAKAGQVVPGRVKLIPSGTQQDATVAPSS